MSSTKHTIKLANKTVIISITSALIVFFLLIVGFAAGYYTVVNSFKKQIQKYSQSETLGNLLSNKQKRETAHAYYDGEMVVEKIDGFSWAVPNIPTPFVGNGPMPGKHNNAYINLMQFRVGNDEILVPKPTNTYRIFLTGGSTAFGSGAPTQDRTVAGYLSGFLKTIIHPSIKLKYEVITMANPAWASTHERIIIENRLSELEPDMVISLSGNNDVHWAERGRNILWFRSYADEFYLTLINTAYEFSGENRMPEIIEIDKSPISPDVVVERLVKNLKLSSYVLYKTPYVFVLQPTLAVTKKSLTKREQDILIEAGRQFKNHIDYVRKCYNEIDFNVGKLEINNFHYINLSNIFDSMNDEEDVFIDSYHFGDKGNELIARSIFEHVRKFIE